MTDARAAANRDAENRAAWGRLIRGCLPFADAATTELPLSRLLRLSLFQVSVGMTTVLLTGTLNRVLIVELGVAAAFVGLMVALPFLFAPFRALVGWRSDTHRSHLGWRRGPYVWFGTLMQFGGLAITPFALLILAGDGTGPRWIGTVAALFAFVLTGTGVHVVQTAGLALACDLAPERVRPRAVALLYVMLLVGMLVSALAFGAVLHDFDAVKLIGVVQGAAVIAMVLNMAALWKQEAQNLALTAPGRPRTPFAEAWSAFAGDGRVGRLLTATGLGAAGFAMQDVLLEPYGGQILHMTVGETTALTALWAGGTLVGLWRSATALGRGLDPHRLAGHGLLWGAVAFALVICAAPIASTPLFMAGVFGIGFGGGLFGCGALNAAMALGKGGGSGVALGAWGAVQASSVGLAVFAGGALRDLLSRLAAEGALGPALTDPAVAYGVVWHLEIALLFAALVAIGPLARFAPAASPETRERFGLAELPA